jgi:hypothetical protein
MPGGWPLPAILCVSNAQHYTSEGHQQKRDVVSLVGWRTKKTPEETVKNASLSQERHLPTAVFQEKEIR